MTNLNMDVRNKVLLTLDAVSLTYLQKCQVISIFNNNYNDIWNKFSRKYEMVKVYVGEQKCSFLENRFNDAMLDITVNALKGNGISFCTPFMSEYPKKLKGMPLYPLVLYYRGDISIFDKKTVAIAGSRKFSGYGRKVVEYFVNELVDSDIAIVGGLSHGIESIAHQAALKNNGKTAAILPSGFYNVYPEDNLQLYNSIVQKGVVISEHNPYVHLEKYNFEYRNRLIAAFSDSILLVEAGASSGAFSIFDYASEYGRNIHVIPGEIFSPYSEGTNSLIQTYGTLIATSPEDIVRSLNTVYVSKALRKIIKISPMEKTVADLLLQDDLTANEIAERSGIPIHNVLSCLSSLEILGVIRNDTMRYKLNSEVIYEVSDS